MLEILIINEAVKLYFISIQYLQSNHKKDTNNNGEPLAFSYYEMGTMLSDNYSYLDMSAEELSAKGNGGLRMMHSYTGWSDNQSIATPPDDYVPNKVGNVDMGKLQEKRNTEVSGKR